MKSTKFVLNTLLFAAFLFFVSCGGNNETAKTDATDSLAVNESSLLLDYISAEKNPMTATPEEGGFPKFITAQEVNDNLGGYMAILDLRGAEDFAHGHIDGAINVKPNDLVAFMSEDFNPEGFDKIVMVCYSGQIASYSAALLSMMGVKNVYAMKWGMSAWNKKFAYKWEEALADKDAPALETTDVPMAAVGTTTPTLTTGKATGAEIATAQVQKLLGEGFTPARVKFEDIAADMSKYYIISVQEKENYTLGHLPGAVNYDFATSFGKDQKLNTLPTDKPILVYCNSGQKAAFVVAYLRMLGYDAYSLLYGANGFMNSKLKTVKDATFTPELINKFDFIESEFKGDGGHGGGGC